VQLRWLSRQGLRGVSVGELLDAHAAGTPRGLVGLSFDDGYADFAEHAVPVLRRHGCTATVFVVAGRMGEDNTWDPEGPRKPILTAEALTTVAAADMEIGSHGFLHTSLPEAPEATLTSEVGQSRMLLENVTGTTVRGFCYPYGHVSARAVNAVATAGYDYGCAIWQGPTTGRLALPRTYIGQADRGSRLWAKRARHRITPPAVR
jgi:peptidoglycan/xylan/chitin deacetylase (PgdA/CDA1 family)